MSAAGGWHATPRGRGPRVRQSLSAARKQAHRSRMIWICASQSGSDLPLPALPRGSIRAIRMRPGITRLGLRLRCSRRRGRRGTFLRAAHRRRGRCGTLLRAAHRRRGWRFADRRRRRCRRGRGRAIALLVLRLRGTRVRFRRRRRRRSRGRAVALLVLRLLRTRGRIRRRSSGGRQAVDRRRRWPAV